MAILLTRLARVELARSFVREVKNVIDSDTNKLYDYYNFALARTTAWTDEESPETAYDSQKYINQFRNNILFTQKVNTSDVCNLIRRIDWEEGTDDNPSIYDAYDDDYSENNPAPSGATTLADAEFYVYTRANRVYKCIDNRNAAGIVIASTVEPDLTSTDIFETGDGYKWKFMYQLSEADQNKFLDTQYIPVRKLTTDSPAYGTLVGEVKSITVTNGGSGYTSAPTVYIQGDGTGARASATINGSGEVSSVTIDSENGETFEGLGYTFAFVQFEGGGGEGAEAIVTLGDADPENTVLQKAVENAAIEGTIERILVVDGGRDYVAGATFVKITGDSVLSTDQAAATVTIAEGTGTITAIEIDDVGANYNYADITFVDSNGDEIHTAEDDLSKKATARAIISPIHGHGSNPVRELFSTTVGIVSSLSDNTNRDLMVDNDFRQIGLLKNIYDYDEQNIWREATATTCFIANVSSSANYAIDDIIVTDEGDADEGRFRVIQIVESTATEGTFDIYLQSIIPNIKNASVLKNVTQDISSLTINSVTDPEISTAYGEVIYIENRTSIARSTDQVETIKAIVQF
ncbi:hypothetical protein N9H34_01735 [bacterium]|nr:hypothetical protein [bacterium]